MFSDYYGLNFMEFSKSLMRVLFFLICLICLNIQIIHANPTQVVDPLKKEEQALIRRVNEPFTGDLVQIKERRLLRVLVSYSKTNFFFDHGRMHGLESELLKTYEKFLNNDIKKRYSKIKMVFVPKPFDQILIALKGGYGDIAAAGLTITPERKEIVNFTQPYIPNVNEVVVLNKQVRDIQTVDDLSDRMVYVRSGSSYVTHLKALNNRMTATNRAPIKIKEAAQHIVTEDILELANAGIIKITVVDHHIAEAWAKILPDIVIRKDLKIHTGGKIAWAARKENPKLLASLNAFIRRHKKGSLIGNVLFKRYYQDSKWINNPNSGKERDKLIKLRDLLQRFGKQYEFNYLALAAMAYQESGFDNSKQSPQGAVGIMQVLPSTAADKRINIKNIHKLENNIHAGTKYLHFLLKRYFSSPDIEPADRLYFSWAAYNAGPAKINYIRSVTAKRGFNPNRWFFNVERIAARVIGRETVTYVSNIYKYYIAYQLYFDMYKDQIEIK